MGIFCAVKIPNPTKRLETCSINWFDCTTNNKELFSAIKLGGGLFLAKFTT